MNFCIEKQMINEHNFYQHFMLACENQKLINVISNSEIYDLRNSLALLCLCKLNLKSKNYLMGLYLKLLSNMVPLFAQHGLV